MIDADDLIVPVFDAIERRNPESIRQAVYFAIEETQKLIDPVPDNVRVIYDGQMGDDEYTRVAEGGNVWRHECGCCYSTFAVLNAEYGPMTWEEKG